MLSISGCERRLKEITKDSEKYKFSRCLGCTGPIPIEGETMPPSKKPQIEPSTPTPATSVPTCRCGRGPIKYDKSGRSCGVCQTCIRERVKKSNAKRTENARQAKAMLETKIEPPMALVQMVKAARISAIDAVSESTGNLLYSTSRLVTALDALAAVGGIPGWEGITDLNLSDAG